MAKVRQWLYLKDEEGVPIENAYLNLYLTGTETKAIIFSDSIGTSLDQSTWTTTTSGFFNFYIGNEWDPDGYDANQEFDLVWSLAPFNYLTDGDMETDPTSAWTPYNATLVEETTIVRSGSKSLKVIDTGSTACAYQLISTEPGVKYRVTGYTYIPSTLGIIASNIFAGRYLTGVEYGGTQITVEDSWQAATFDFTATTTTTYIHLNCQGPANDGSEYCFYDDISIDRLTAVTKSGVIDRIQLFTFIFSVDETDFNTDRNKLLSNQLAYKIEQHVNTSYPSEPHNIQPVNTGLKDGSKNKVVSDVLIAEIDKLLEILLASDSVSATPEKRNIKTILLDTFTPSGDGYYTDLVHTLDTPQWYPQVQFYEYLKDPTTWGSFYRDQEPIRTSVSAGSFEIIHPVAIQDISPSAIRVYTVNDNWLMATVAGSGAWQQSCNKFGCPGDTPWL